MTLVFFNKKFCYKFATNKYISFKIKNDSKLIISYNNIERSIPGKVAIKNFFQSIEYKPTEEDMEYLFNESFNSNNIFRKVKTIKKVRLMLKFTSDNEISNLSSFFVKWKDNDVWDRYPFTMLNMQLISSPTSNHRLI